MNLDAARHDFDDGSFQELDMLARHRSQAMGLEKNRPYTDGVVTGFGTIDGRIRSFEYLK